MMSSKIESIAYYLVWKWLSGHDNVVHALYHYFVEGKSPSILAPKYGFSKSQIRGYIQRIMEKAGGSRTVARACIKMLYPLVVRIKKPFKIVREEEPKIVLCRICGEEVMFDVYDAHLRNIHPEFLEAMVQLILEKLCERVRRR